MPTPVRKPDPHACYWCANNLPHPPRVRVRVHVPPRPRTWTLDPILARSLVAFTFGLSLIALGILLQETAQATER